LARCVLLCLAGPGIGEALFGSVHQAKGIIKLPKGEQPGIGRDPRTVRRIGTRDRR